MMPRTTSIILRNNPVPLLDDYRRSGLPVGLDLRRCLERRPCGSLRGFGSVDGVIFQELLEGALLAASIHYLLVDLPARRSVEFIGFIKVAHNALFRGTVCTLLVQGCALEYSDLAVVVSAFFLAQGSI